MKANLLAALTLTIALAACAAPQQTPAPAPRPASTMPAAAPSPLTPQRTPPPAADWRDAPLSPGDWTWSAAGARSTARYGIAGQAPALTFSCDRGAGTVVLARSGTATESVPLVVTTTTVHRVLAGTPAPDGSATISAAIPARDPLLDAIVFSRGRFMVETVDNPAVIAPSWPEVARVIEDCRG